MNSKLREHYMCTLEIIRNLDELENFTGRQVDIAIVEKIIHDSPIYVPS